MKRLTLPSDTAALSLNANGHKRGVWKSRSQRILLERGDISIASTESEVI